METKLVPIKVKIGLRPNGHADHPAWSKMPMVNSWDDNVREWCPSSWLYDKSCGHDDERIESNKWDSPQGMQWGCLLCTREFVNEAKQIFPDIVTELTEAEFEDFYNNYSRAHMSENDYDIEALQGLQLELDLKEKLGKNKAETDIVKAKIEKALDSNDKERGIRKNEERYCQDYLKKKGFTIKK